MIRRACNAVVSRLYGDSAYLQGLCLSGCRDASVLPLLHYFTGKTCAAGSAALFAWRADTHALLIVVHDLVHARQQTEV
jgi:hypothetical protein